ncbi:hypothetical protein BS50DRAFT_95605 [Corynespora cassiicola Philippines]|uniref:Uncharacterized protein n=1 Tax=Corynespora cassiicola Philippines TaxID=1448308 RepID=A0A2T2NG57_CORCC|nr:hypothetical protein BS50DRAFT_95605 [Corynespora cassiicola Philippines]
MGSASLAVPGGSGAVQKGGEERHVVTGKATPAHIIEQSFYSPLGRSRRVESTRGKAGSAAGRVWDCCCPVEPRPAKWCVCRRVAHRNCTGQDRTGQYTFCWSTPMPPIHPLSSHRASVLVWGIWVGPGWPRPSTQPVVDPAGFDHHYYHAQPVPTTGARTQYYRTLSVVQQTTPRPGRPQTLVTPNELAQTCRRPRPRFTATRGPISAKTLSRRQKSASRVWSASAMPALYLVPSHASLPTLSRHQSAEEEKIGGGRAKEVDAARMRGNGLGGKSKRERLGFGVRRFWRSRTRGGEEEEQGAGSMAGAAALLRVAAGVM